MITQDEWEEYSEYLDELSDEEFHIEMQWLESIGKAKQRGSIITSVENYTIQ
jgi:hypothetical protein